MMDPGQATWRYVAGVGLWNGSGFVAVPAATAPSAETPASGTVSRPAPAIFNLAFRFNEPSGRVQGVWFEDAQSAALAGGTSGAFGGGRRLRPARLGPDGAIHAPGAKQARILPSSQALPEGVRAGFPQFGGRLQPYLLYVPPGYVRGRPTPLTFGLHSLGGAWTQFSAFSPNQTKQFGAERGSFYVTPHGRGPSGWYTNEAEVDFFEVWRDLARRFTLDPRRVAISGYSMGGYGTYKLGVEWPDCSVAPSPPSARPVTGPGCRRIRPPWASRRTRTCCSRTPAGFPTSTGPGPSTSWFPTSAFGPSRPASTR